MQMLGEDQARGGDNWSGVSTLAVSGSIARSGGGYTENTVTSSGIVVQQP